MHLAPPMRRLRWPCSLLLVLGIAPAAPACSIPVFRYALERWELSPYEFLVFHRGALPADTRSFLDSLPGRGNFVVTPVDLDGVVSPALQQLWDRHGKRDALPWMIVRGTEAGAKAAPIWTGPTDAARLRPVFDSEARQKAVAALSEGKSVFVLLLSGDGATDAAAVRLLRGQLAKLEKLVKLPEQRGDGPRMRLALPLAVGFTVLPLRRDDPSEQTFIRVLLSAEKGLDKVSGPMAFPIFGRGRLLGCLHGEELDADNVFEVVNFLCGECSCQVKELNPGMDLPIAAEWTAIFARIGTLPDDGIETPPGATRIAARAKPAAGSLSPGTSKPVSVAPDGVRVADSQYPPAITDAAPTTVTQSPHRRWLWLGTAAAALLVVITGIWACLHGRRGRPN